MPSGSAYLEGATVTVAGAALLQRVAGAVVKFGGNVLSTQLDVQGTPSKAGYLSMIASCEIEQAQLQQVLYDLEAGMPFLFVDQLVVQTPLGGSGEHRQAARAARRVRAMARCKVRRGVRDQPSLAGDGRCMMRPRRRSRHPEMRSTLICRTKRGLPGCRCLLAGRAGHFGPGCGTAARAGANAKRQSAVGHSTDAVIRHARPADLFPVAASATRRRRPSRFRSGLRRRGRSKSSLRHCRWSVRLPAMMKATASSSTLRQRWRSD